MANEDQNDLARIFEQASIMRADLINDLSYEDMLVLSDTFIGWSMGKKVSPEQSAKLLGRAEGLKDLAEHMGPEWVPPPQPRLSLLASLARRCRKGQDD